ncbi:cyd operon YbgE family protein [Pseudomonas sp. 10B1]|uniref:cyd operon YbgE family protein n=1 Tax=unclassified Pseudomonas TaxID=196821 RepID=UPI002AB5DB0D|nr:MULTISPECIES: cyd operon YbgE family protein [unclassified Pseudomonas]MDY7559630.1 cyd operon YbgE family protein [Pseudomonas sp. AB6]MEA9978462.1 cyd operon YbgE family protein [Pseudomonas sp. RTS4]MEA9993134.1 cyd operon YbgE family protein [Pseudomonas sp. AA4]MEB0086076.1 cyd operon YbgE family protein [Pseudomonas sp. RTI1]MEB0125488.1 cyd operon YbgE family protein [Pseudomonas sp. CCC1.2]
MTHVANVPPTSRIHVLSLIIAVAIMLACTLYPPLIAAADGKADHALATALFAAMSVAFVNGVGFVPRAPVWRWLFSGWTCLAALALAGWIKFLL